MKKEFIEKIKKLFKVELVEDTTFKVHRNIIYTKLPKHNNSLLSYLKTNYRIEEHLNNYYWIWLN